MQAQEPAAQQLRVVRHFKRAKRLHGKQEGNISIFWFDHGWFWFIPLADGTTSVGAVCWPYYLKSRAKPLPEFFRDTIALCPQLAERLKDADARRRPVYATGNYSYMQQHSSGERYLMLGDAFAFIDPVFSSGVYLAMHSAFDGADVVATCSTARRRRRRRARASTRVMRKGPQNSRGSSSASPIRPSATSSWTRAIRCA